MSYSTERDSTSRGCARLFFVRTLCAFVFAASGSSDARASITGMNLVQGVGVAGQTTTNVLLGGIEIIRSGGAANTFDRITFQTSGTINEQTQLTNVRAYFTTGAGCTGTQTAFGTANPYSFSGDNASLTITHGSALTAGASPTNHCILLYADITGSPSYGSTIIIAGANLDLSPSTTRVAGPTASTSPGVRISQVSYSTLTNNGATEAYIGSSAHLASFSFTMTGAGSLSSVTLGSASGGFNESTNLSSVRAYVNTSSAASTAGTQLSGTTFASDGGNVTLTGTGTLTAGTTNYVHVYADVTGGTIGENIIINLQDFAVNGVDKAGTYPSGNTSPGPVLAPPPPEFFDGAESGATYMSTIGSSPNWAYDTTANKFDAGSRSFHAGDGTNTALCSIMETPVLKLNPTGEPELSFRALLDLEYISGNYDWLAVQISTEDGGYTDWTASPFASWHTTVTSANTCGTAVHSGNVIGGATREGNTIFSTQGETFGPIALPYTYLGKKVKVRFIFSQDTSTPSHAWIDQIRLTDTEASLTLSGLPTAVTAGTPYNVTVTARSSNGMIDTTYTGTVDLTSSDGTASLPADYTFVGGDAGVKVFSVTFNAGGNHTLTATDTVTSTLTSSQSTAVEDPAYTFLDGAETGATFSTPVGTAPDWSYTTTAGKFDVGARSFRAGDGTVGTGLCKILETPTLKLKSSGGSAISFRGLFDLEASGATAAWDWVAVQMATSDDGFATWSASPFSSWHGGTTIAGTAGCASSVHTGTVIGGSARDLGTAVTFAANGETFSAINLPSYAGKQVKFRFIFSQDTASGASQAWIDQIKVTNVDPILVITGLPTTANTGQAYTITVTAKNLNGSTNTGYTGTVTFTSTDGTASLPSNYTFVGGDAGVKTFSVTFNTSGQQTLTVTDTVTSSLNGSASVPVENAADLFIDGAESGATYHSLNAGTDAWVYDTAAGKFDVGSRSFRAGNGSTQTGLCSILESPIIKLKATGSAQFSFRGLFDLEDSGANNYDWLAVQIATEDGNYQDWTTGPMADWHTAGMAGIPACGASIHSGNVIGGATRDDNTTFSTQGETIGPVSLASYAGKKIKLRFIFSQDTATIASQVWLDQIRVTNTEGYLVITGAPTAPVVAGTSYNITLTAKDKYGVTNTGYVQTVSFSSTDGAATLPGNYTYVVGDSGTKTFSITLNTPGHYRVTATDNSSPSLTAIQDTYSDTATARFFDNTESAGSFRYHNNLSGWTVSSAVTPPSGTYSYSNSSGTAGCYQLESDPVQIPTGAKPWVEFSARMDFGQTGANWYDHLVVEIATAESGYTDWDYSPLASLHAQSKCPNCMYACSPTTSAVIAANSASFASYRSALPTTYAGKTVKLRFTVVQYPSTTNTIYIDDVKIVTTQPYMNVSGYVEPAEELTNGSVTVEALDYNGQRQTSNNNTITLTSDDGGMSYPGPTALSSGVVTISNIKFLTGEWYLQGSDGSLTGRQSGITINPPGFSGSAMSKYLLDLIPNPFYSGGTSTVRVRSATSGNSITTNYSGTARLSSGNGGFTVSNQSNYTHPDLTFTIPERGSRVLNGLTLTGTGTHYVKATERGTILFGPENVEHPLTETDDAYNYLTIKDVSVTPADGPFIRTGIRAWHMLFGTNLGHFTTSKKITLPPVNLVPSGQGTAQLKFYWRGSGTWGSTGATNFFYVQKSTDGGTTWSRLEDTGNSNYNGNPANWLDEMNPCTTSHYEASEEKLGMGSAYPNTIFGKSLNSWQLATFSLAALQHPTLAKPIQLRVRFCTSGLTAPIPAEFVATDSIGYAIDDISISNVDSMVNSGDVWEGSQTGIVVTPVDHFLVTGLPDPFETQTANSITVTARDSSNNVITNYTGTVTFDETALGLQAGESLPANYTFTNSDLGTHTFMNGVTLVDTGARTVRVRDNGDLSKAGSQAVTVQDTGVKLQLETEAGPPANTSPGASGVILGTFKVSLSKTATATDLTSIKLTLTGTAANGDITGITIYRDSDANYGNGTQASSSTQTFSGSPGTTTYASLSGWSVSATPTYIHVIADFAGGIANGTTAGAKIAAVGDVIHSQSYAFYTLKAPPTLLGDTTILGAGTKTWVGTTTSWSTSGNWSPAGAPTSTDDVLIPSAAANPVITGSVVVKSLTISSGNLSVSGSPTLKIDGGGFGNSSSGSFSPGTGTVLISGTPSVQNVTSQDAFYNLSIDKSAGAARIGGDVIVSNLLTLVDGTLEVGDSATLVLNQNTTLAKTLSLLQSSTLEIASGRTLTVASGGTLRTNISNGSNDLSKYATFTRAGASGTHSIVIQSGATINVPYSNFRYLGSSGLQIQSGATITAGGLDHVFYRNPPNSGTLLSLGVAPPGSAITDTGFFTDGATSVTNINGTSNTSYTVTTSGGDRNGDAYEVQGGSTVINWATAPGAPTQLVFTNAALNQNANACGTLTLVLRDANGTTVNAGQDYTINLTTTSANGTFHTANDCTSSSISSTTLTSGQSTLTLYYKDATAGTPTTTATEVPSGGLTDATQGQTINSTGGAPAKLALTGPGTVTFDTCSSQFEVIVQDSGDVETNATANTTVVFSGGGKATFYSDAGCSTPVTSRVISSGTSRTSFYYKANASGTYRICKYRKSSTATISPTMSGNLTRICAETDQF